MTNELLRFDGRVAIITGAGRGLGRSHALALARRGAHVVVNDLGSTIEGGGCNGGVAQVVVDEIQADGGSAIADGSDISTPAGADAVVAAAVAAFGRVDVVVNNAGILRWTAFPQAMPQELDAHLAVHVAASFNVTRAAWPHLVAVGRGNVIVTTSSAIFGGPTIASYSAAKAALIGLMRSLATAGAEHRIVVNALAPTAWTRMMESSGVSAGDAIAVEMRPELVSAALTYLAHDSCDASGEVCVAGGGRVARMFIGETRGYRAEDLTPEDVRDHWPQAVDASSYFVPTDNDRYAHEQAAFLRARPTASTGHQARPVEQ
jgi:NAD(P)-dependent dehydrogenase (short-subunit alcohol dehydrogenase family)